MAQPMTLDVNGRAAHVSVDDPETPLLYAVSYTHLTLPTKA